MLEAGFRGDPEVLQSWQWILTITRCTPSAVTSSHCLIRGDCVLSLVVGQRCYLKSLTICRIHWRWMPGCFYSLSQTWLVPHTGQSFLLEYALVFLCGRPWWLQSMTVFLNSVFWLPLLQFLWFLYLLYKSRLWLRFCFCVLSKSYDSFINNKFIFSF